MQRGGKKSDKDVHDNAVHEIENLAAAQTLNNSGKQTVVVLMLCGY